MARYVFYSFHYQKDISRVMVVRNRWVTHKDQMASGIIDHADFEKLQRKGNKAVENWIDKQMEGTTATIVLIGEETLKRPYVQYEIKESIRRGNAVIGVYINKLKDFAEKTSKACSAHTEIGKNYNGTPVYFDEIAAGIYDYVDNDGYNNLGKWVEVAVED